MPMIRQEKIDYGRRYCLDHGIQPRGSVKGKKVGKRRATKLSEQSPRKWQWLSPEKFVRVANNFLRKGE
jgi:hypothetical protein